MKYFCLLLLLSAGVANAGEWSLFQTDRSSVGVSAAVRPVVWAYLAENLPPDQSFPCYACELLKADLKGETRFQFIKPEPPSWVRAYPCLQWKGENGKYYVHYGADFADFLDSYQQTNPQAAARLKIGVDIVRADYHLQGWPWSINGDANPSRATLIEHLLSGFHAGKFSDTYLNRLSTAELISLHGDDHEQRVDWNRVSRPPDAAPRIQYSQPATGRSRRRRLFRGGCPSGRCPY